MLDDRERLFLDADNNRSKRRLLRRCLFDFGPRFKNSNGSITILMLIILCLYLGSLWLGDFNSPPPFERPVEMIDEAFDEFTCDCNGENFCFKGLDENGSTINGKKFDCSLYDGLRDMELLDSNAAKPDFEHLDDSWKPVFVTFISSNHFNEGRRMVRSVADNYPDSTIVVFDIGLNISDINEVKGWCHVEYRKFDFSRYPRHVSNLKNYSFKIAIIEAIKEYKTFFYFDASVRVTGKNLLDFLHGVRNKRLLPFSSHTYAPHSVFSAIHPEMSSYLPLPILITQIKEIQSGFLFVSDSVYTRHILKWWYLCAMTEECIAPKDSTSVCNLRRFHDHKRTYMNCHRFDQAYYNCFETSHLFLLSDDTFDLPPNSPALAYLFGEKRGALELGYVKEDWTVLTENLIVQVENARDSAMKRFFSLASIKRRDVAEEPLELKCKDDST